MRQALVPPAGKRTKANRLQSPLFVGGRKPLEESVRKRLVDPPRHDSRGNIFLAPQFPGIYAPRVHRMRQASVEHAQDDARAHVFGASLGPGVDVPCFEGFPHGAVYPSSDEFAARVFDAALIAGVVVPRIKRLCQPLVRPVAHDPAADATHPLLLFHMFSVRRKRAGKRQVCHPPDHLLPHLRDKRKGRGHACTHQHVVKHGQMLMLPVRSCSKWVFLRTHACMCVNKHMPSSCAFAGKHADAMTRTCPTTSYASTCSPPSPPPTRQAKRTRARMYASTRSEAWTDAHAPSALM